MNSSAPDQDNWQDGLDEASNAAAFEELFMHEVESWFSANIACCDNCHDEFVAEWPYAYSADDAKFQRNSIDLRVLYSGSHLHEWYTQAEFTKLLPSIKCPNCGESLAHNIWPYELPFTPPSDYDITLSEIAHQASETPFLLLDHPFCAKVRNAISEISKTSGTSCADDFLFRGRSLSGESSPNLIDFDFPPTRFVKEGRYNHAGDPVLYLASSERVCRAEMRDAEFLFIAKFRFAVPLKILDLMSPHDTGGEHSDVLSFIVFSTLLSARSQDKGFSRPEYVFSRFVKDCAKSSGFDAIRYPSTRVGASRFDLVVINRELTLAKYATESCVLLAESSTSRAMPTLEEIKVQEIP